MNPPTICWFLACSIGALLVHSVLGQSAVLDPPGHTSSPFMLLLRPDVKGELELADEQPIERKKRFAAATVHFGEGFSSSAPWKSAEAVKGFP
jgi:hypothetical protein